MQILPTAVLTASRRRAANYRVSSSNRCVACPGSSTNVAGDDSTGSATACDCPTGYQWNTGTNQCDLCAANYHVSSGACVACTSGFVRDAGDSITGGDTACAAGSCDEGYHVSSSVCVQYFRDTSTHAMYQRYLETNAYLPEINNEGQANANAEYRDAIASLERFVMFMFENDDMVNPPESSWFGSRVVGGLNRSQIVPYDRNSAIYQNLGLDALDADGRLELRLVPGARHMQFDVDWFTREVDVYSDRLLDLR